MEFPVQIPERFLEKAQTLHIFPEDIEENFVRGAGAGGQKINKTSSCVWLKHLPTGTEVKCQEYRQREVNRSEAYKLLILKIEERILGKKSERAQKNFKLRKQKMRRSRKAKEKTLEYKAHRSVVKENRQKIQF